MNIEKMREEFEEWWKCTPILKENKRTLAEKAWQASRAAVVVDLPSDQCIDIHGYSPKATKLYCRKAIEAAGLKVES